MTDTTTPDPVPYCLTLATLRARLQELSHLPDDTPVILQKDAEGNGYSPLADGGEGMYLADSTYSGETYPTPEQIAADRAYTEEDEAPEDAIRVIILRPVN